MLLNLAALLRVDTCSIITFYTFPDLEALYFCCFIILPLFYYWIFANKAEKENHIICQGVSEHV